HPSDNLGSISAVADYMSRNGENYTLNDILKAMIKAHEIQGILALDNSFNRVGLDHVLLVRIASTALACHLFKASFKITCNALSQAWADGGALRTYRHAPNTGSRKSWAAGDACARAVFLALKSMKGEMGYASVLSADTWGFEDILFNGQKVTLPQKLNSYVMDNILFKISFPAEFHAQTAVEAAFLLHPQVIDQLDQIERIELFTQESGFRIINKSGPLNNPADRDHCLQYMVAIGHRYGELTADHYEDNIAANRHVDLLRDLMICHEDKQYSKDYLDPQKRSIANSIQVYYEDGSCSKKIELHYPVGHRRRRDEGIPLLLEKFSNSLNTRFTKEKSAQINELCNNAQQFQQYSILSFSNLFASEEDL
ncbi:MAG: 2-methylcitrate dehydratase, partial [Lentisphaeraceae bacterium]|nr:2-methylcitrate dehydratase [Lentisphaeraceae bacterium]